MSNSLNKVQLIGNTTADPEVKQTTQGTKVALFSVATNRKWKDAAWVVQDDVEYHNVVAWRWLAELAEQYIQKWKKVYIEWYLKTRSWDDTNGVKRYKTEIVADNMIFLNNSNGTQSVHTEEDAQPQKAKTTTKKDEETISIEDIPF